MPSWLKRCKSKESLEKARITARIAKKRYYKRNAINRENSENKKRYTEKEIEMIMEHKIPDSQLSKILGRSLQAIQIKRSKLLQGRKL